jgi:hypothetical protein
MASRFETLLAAIRAQYAGDADTGPFLVGAEHLHEHRNWQRVVCAIVGGPINAPTHGAQGRETADGGRVDCVFERRPTVQFALWGDTFEQAENRLHALLLAIENVTAQADVALSDLQEAWVRTTTEAVTEGGSLVVLSARVQFDVLTTDANVVTYDAALNAANDPNDPDPPPPPDPPRPDVGESVPTIQATSVAIVAKEDPTGETFATVTIEDEE